VNSQAHGRQLNDVPVLTGELVRIGAQIQGPFVSKGEGSALPCLLGPLTRLHQRLKKPL
jgi:hypothetical protein